MKELKTLIKTLVEQAIIQPVVDNLNIYVDMDGVIADFDAGVSSNNPKIEKAKESYLKILSGFPDLKSLPEDDIKKRLAGAQVDPGLKALKKAFNYYRELKYISADKPGFFLNLPVMNGAQELITGIVKMTGKKPVVLTAPVDSNSARCEAEKREWINKNFPGMFQGFICTQEKEKYANSNAVLIDDRTKYTSKFVASGGNAILFKTTSQALMDLENIISSKANK